MKKKILLLLMGVLTLGILNAQIAINTDNPQQLFHVDGKGDNNITGTPTVSQQLNDVVITENGRVGIGTTNPTTKLHIAKDTGNLLYLETNNPNPYTYLISDLDGNAYFTTVISSWNASLVRSSTITNSNSAVVMISNCNNTSSISSPTEGAINIVNGSITVPHNGIYRITTTGHWALGRSTTTQFNYYRVGIVIYVNGVERWNPMSIGFSHAYGISPTFSNMLRLNAGDVITFGSDQRYTLPYGSLTNATVPVASSIDLVNLDVEFLQN